MYDVIGGGPADRLIGFDGDRNRGGATTMGGAGECGADGARVQDSVTGVRAAVDAGQHEIWGGTERASGREEGDERRYRADRIGVHIRQTVEASSFDDDASVISDGGECGATSARVVEWGRDDDVQTEVTRGAS